MMIIVWRGWGWLAVVALLLPLAAFGLAIGLQPSVGAIAAGVAAVVAGAACWVYGRQWNAVVTAHSLYFVPLQYWGIVHMALGVAIIGLGLISIDWKAV